MIVPIITLLLVAVYLIAREDGTFVDRMAGGWSLGVAITNLVVMAVWR